MFLKMIFSIHLLYVFKVNSDLKLFFCMILISLHLPRCFS